MPADNQPTSDAPASAADAPVTETRFTPAPDDWGGGASSPAPQASGGAATGPKTDGGKRIAGRNATTHGLFARDIVLPHLGEDPEAFDAFLQELTSQINPKNLLERHYTEKIAAASWRLRRLHRWQAQLFENTDISEDQVLHKLDSVLRHETALHRQIDMSVKMIGRELPRLFEDRAHKQAMYEYGVTERYCARNVGTGLHVAGREYEIQERPLAPPDLDLSRLDTAPDETETAAPERAAPDAEAENCQNEPLPLPPFWSTEETGRRQPEPGLFRSPMTGAAPTPTPALSEAGGRSRSDSPVIGGCGADPGPRGADLRP